MIIVEFPSVSITQEVDGEQYKLVVIWSTVTQIG